MIRRRSTLPPVISASGAYYLAHGLMVLAGLISMPVMTRILSKADYGVLGLLYATISVLAVIGGMGFGEAALRLYSEQRGRATAPERELCNTLLGGSLLASGIFALIVAGSALWIGGSRFVQCLPLASVLVVIRAASAVFFQIYRAQERAVAHALTQIFQRYGTMVLAISLLLFYRRDAEMVIIAAIVIEVIAVAARWIDLARQGTISMPALSRPVLVAATAYGLPLALAGSARFLLDYSDRFLIGRLLGLDAVAMYSVPNDVTIRLGEALWAPIQLAALPIMFRLWESDGPQATSRFGSDVLSYMIAIMLPIATLFLIHSEEIIVTLASAKYEGAGHLIPYLLPGVLLSSINSIVAVGLTVQKRSATVALTVFGAALFNIGLNLILIPRFQLVGAAVATTIAQAALLVANRVAGSNLDLRLHAGPILKAMIATAVPVSLLYAFGRVPSTSIITLAVNLGVGTGAAALIFVALEPRVRRLAWLGQDALKTPAAAEHGHSPSDRRVLIVARDFPPATTSGTIRTASFLRHLPAFGWKASVVTIRASHANIPATATPQLAPDCHVFRAFGFDTKVALAIRGRYPGFLGFPDRDASWIFDGVRQALRAHRHAAADAIWSTSPSVSAHCIAFFTKRRTGLPWIADLRDPWNLGTPLGPVARAASRWLERRMLADADAIVVTTQGMAADLERRCGDRVRGKLRLIPNGYEAEEFTASPATQSPSPGFRIAHVGGCLPPYRDPSSFLRALRICIERGDLPADTRVDFIGAADDPGSLRTEIERFDVQDQVRVTGRVSAIEAVAAIVATPLLLLLQTRDLHALCIPTKAYEYLRSGSSILAITPGDSETAALVRAFAGVSMVAPDDIDGIAGALAASYRAWVDGAARGFVRDVDRYDRRRLAGELAQLLDEVRLGRGLQPRGRRERSRPIVLHIVDSLQAGGTETNLAVLIAGTIDKYEHHVCCVRSSGIVADRLRALDVPVTVIGKRGTRDWSMAWRLARHCRQVRPQIVHTRNSGTLDGIVAARLAGAPVVIHSEHGLDAATIPWRARWSLWALSPLVDRMLTVSEDLRRRLRDESGVYAEKISVARNGVDAGRFHPRSDRLDLRRRHGYADTDLIIGVAARLGSVKDHVSLINAFSRVAERRTDARLLIVGEGPERGRIEHEVERLSLAARVRLVGERADVEMWLAMLDLFAYAPRFEGMPNGVLEAMATGLPVVVTRVGGVPEVVIDGVTGRLVPLDDIDALTAAIDLYCADPATRAAHGAAGRARVLAEFKPETMLAAYVAAYDGAMAARGVIPIPQSDHRDS